MKKRKTRAQRSRPFRCPHCGAAMILRPAAEIYRDCQNLRIQAHRKFDRIWQTGIMTRENAYRWFADSFGLSLKDAHIGMCSEYRCKELIRLCDEVLARNHRVA